MDFALVCLPCKGGLHSACSVLFAGDLADELDCCCSGQYSLREHLVAIKRRDAGQDLEEVGGAGVMTLPAGGASKGNSGYIHPDAWLGARDIGTLKDVESTGRKRVARMYPISGGQVCDWAGKKNCGGGVVPVMGCVNNPATDLHHGPDKNTLNNAKVSRGIGDVENVHVICSECHNAWHAANDPHYALYNRTEQQAEPWLPTVEYSQHEPEEADYDELQEEDRRRHQQARRRGREHRGRNATARLDGDFSVEDDD